VFLHNDSIFVYALNCRQTTASQQTATLVEM